MPILHALVLGIVQGFTEFFPVSSSGHLLLVPWAFGWDDLTGDTAMKKAFDVALHLGTLVAMVAYFRSDLVRYVRDGTRALIHRDRPATTDGRLAWLFVLSAIPAGIAGMLGESFFSDHLGHPWIIAVSLAAFGLLLWWADRRRGRRALETFTARDALVVGAAQILALNPGTSRSGVTITVGRMRGLSRDAAARMSFLMAIPITAGAVVYELAKLVADGIPDGLLAPMIVGVVTSGVTGWVAVWGTIRLVRTRSFDAFVVYRLALAAAVLIALAAGVR